jgi:hypothetical protein
MHSMLLCLPSPQFPQVEGERTVLFAQQLRYFGTKN